MAGRRAALAGVTDTHHGIKKAIRQSLKAIDRAGAGNETPEHSGASKALSMGAQALFCFSTVVEPVCMKFTAQETSSRFCGATGQSHHSQVASWEASRLPRLGRMPCTRAQPDLTPHTAQGGTSCRCRLCTRPALTPALALRPQVAAADPSASCRSSATGDSRSGRGLGCGVMAGAELVLDREVRDWVLLPLTACVLLMQLLRQYVAQVRFRREGRCVGQGLWVAGNGAVVWHCEAALLVGALQPAGVSSTDVEHVLHARLPCCLLLMPRPQLLAGQGKPPPSAADPAKQAAEARGKMAVARSSVLRANGGFLPEPAFRQRKAFFMAKVRVHWALL